jgi:D-ribose pyranase
MITAGSLTLCEGTNMLPRMLVEGIVNPQVLSLVARVRHTNSLIIADAAFPFWPEIETVDISLVRGVPTVLQVAAAILANWKCGEVFMAKEFNANNDRKHQAAFAEVCKGIKMTFEPHLDFKKRVPTAMGLIRTGDTTAYGNMILVSV